MSDKNKIAIGEVYFVGDVDTYDEYPDLHLVVAFDPEETLVKHDEVWCMLMHAGKKKYGFQIEHLLNGEDYVITCKDILEIEEARIRRHQCVDVIAEEKIFKMQDIHYLSSPNKKRD